MTKSIEPEKKVGGAEEEFRPDNDDRLLWEAIDDIMRRVPEEVLSRLPTDGAERHDHHLYGSLGKAPHTS